MFFKSIHLSGAGNNFHVVHDQMVKPSSALVKEMCMHHPADGVFFLKKNSSGNYDWNFYNNDGSLAEMCGNAARCAGYYVQHILKDHAVIIQLNTVAGVVEIKPIKSTKNDRYEVKMPPAKILSHPEYFFCNTGVPHVVIEVPSHDVFVWRRETCEKIRRRADFAPQGTNVTLFYRPLDSQIKVCAQTFERGVEDFTPACGTGAVAAALYVREKYNISKVMVEMPGGDLTVDVSDLNHPIMVGYVEYLMEYVYDIKI